MTVTFNIELAKTDPSYRTEAWEQYKQGNLVIKDNELSWLKDILGISTDENVNEIDGKLELDDNNTKSNSSGNSNRNNATVKLALTAGVTAAATAMTITATSGLSGSSALMAMGNSSGMTLACITAFIIGMLYLATRPNKDEHKELANLQKCMETGNLELVNASTEVESSIENIEELNEELNKSVEEIQQEIAEKEAKLEELLARLEELKAKANSESGLTEEEEAEFKLLSDENGEITTLQSEITSLQTMITENTEGTEDNIENEEGSLDNAENIFNSVTEVADYAATFDEGTKSAATMEAVSQGLNAAMGYAAAASLTVGAASPILFLTPLGQIMRGMALAGAAASTAGVVEQTKFANDIGNEIDVRMSVQDTGLSVNEQIDNAKEIIADNSTSGTGEAGSDNNVPPEIYTTTGTGGANSDDDDKDDDKI